MNDLADKEFQLASAALENCRRYIAAHKTQRWDVVKWGVSVNLALAVAAAIPGLAENPAVNFGCDWRVVDVAVDRGAIRHDLFPKQSGLQRRPGSKGAIGLGS